MKKACEHPGTFLITYANSFYSNLVIDSLDGINHETNIPFDFLESWQYIIVFCSSQLSQAMLLMELSSADISAGLLWTAHHSEGLDPVPKKM